MDRQLSTAKLKVSHPNWCVQDPNQYDDLDEVDRRSDVRLLDSLIMTVQLNVRKLLQVRCRMFMAVGSRQDCGR